MVSPKLPSVEKLSSDDWDETESLFEIGGPPNLEDTSDTNISVTSSNVDVSLIRTTFYLNPDSPLKKKAREYLVTVCATK